MYACTMQYACATGLKKKTHLKHWAKYGRDHLLDLLLVQSMENVLLFISVFPPGERQKEHEKMNVTVGSTRNISVKKRPRPDLSTSLVKI